MYKNKALTLWLALSAALTAGADDKAYLQTDFDKGIPSDYVLIDMDENPVVATDYNRASTGGSWTANAIDTKTNMAAFSFSSALYEFPMENWMITPVVSIKSAEAVLRWRARSVHYDFPEDYKVMVSADGSADPADFTELLSVSGENYLWQQRAIPLADYAGKDVRLAFVGTSPSDRFILAIDDIFVGEPADTAFATTDTSRRFAGAASATAPVSGTVTNIGAPVELGSLQCVTDGGTLTQAVGRAWTAGQTIGYAFDIPVELGKAARYSIVAVPSDGGDPVTIVTDSVFCSHFPQTMLVEEGTATWCNNCPVTVSILNRNVKERFGDEAIVITDHAQDNLTCSDYYIGLSRWVQTLPGIIFNRDGDTRCEWNSFSNKLLNGVVSREVTAYVDMKVERTDDRPGVLAISTTTQFAAPYDNADGRYRIGFGIIEKQIPSGATTIQRNSTTLISYPEYYYMPVSVPQKFQIYHNVSREGSTAFKGVKGSLPETIAQGGSYDFSCELAVPEAVGGADDLFLVAYVLDSISGRVLNVARADIPAVTTGITAAHGGAGGGAIGIAVSGADIRVGFPEAYEPYTVTVCDLAGRVLRSVTGSGTAGEVTVSCPAAAGGCVVVRATQGRNAVTRKLVIG